MEVVTWFMTGVVLGGGVVWSGHTLLMKWLRKRTHE
jgi:hypothetical protein